MHPETLPWGPHGQCVVRICVSSFTHPHPSLKQNTVDRIAFGLLLNWAHVSGSHQGGGLRTLTFRGTVQGGGGPPGTPVRLSLSPLLFKSSFYWGKIYITHNQPS